MIDEILKTVEYIVEGTKIEELPKLIHSGVYPSLIVHCNKVLGKSNIDGVDIDVTEMDDGVLIDMTVNKSIPVPINLCFGVLEKERKQRINVNLVVKRNASVRLTAFCAFPKSHVNHVMDGNFVLEEGATLSYDEYHYHGEERSVVKPNLNFVLHDGATMTTSLVLSKGRVGKLDYNLSMSLGKDAKIVALTRIGGKGDDDITISDNARLVGEKSSAVLKARVVLRDKSRSIFKGKIIGEGSYSRGHIDCKEIVMDSAVAESLPQVKVVNPTARLTHETVVGTVEQKEIQALQVKGLTEEQAIDFLVSKLLE